MMLHGWIGVDLDGTLATFDASDPDVVGPPIPAMVQRVKRWLQEGREVRIVTARAARQSFDKLLHRAEKTRLSNGASRISGRSSRSKRIKTTA